MRLAESIAAAGLCLLLAGLTIGVACASPAGTLSECAARLEPSARGLDALSGLCPGLKQAIAELGYAATLPAEWEKRLTPGQLEDLAAIASRYRGERASAGPSTDAVRAILAGLARERAGTQRSWWDILREWMRSWFASHDERELSWVSRWLDKLSGASGVLSMITLGLVALVILGSAVYLFLELRSSGALERGARASGRTPRSAQPSRAMPGEDDLARAPAIDQPALLLALLVRSLKRTGRLESERHLTHRELARLAVLDDPDQRRRLGRLSGVAEELLYGAHAPAADRVQGAIDDGRTLLRQLAPRLEASP